MGEHSTRINSFDGLRTVAILLVFTSHAATQLAPGGGVGVQVFFALSGYLITSILIRERSRFGSIRLGRFYYRRLLRLYPALIVAVIIGTVVGAFAGYDHLGIDAAAALTYTSNLAGPLWGVSMNTPLVLTWSLSVEEQFYLIWPFALIGLLSLPAGRRGTVVGCAALAAVCVTIFFFFTIGGVSTYVLPTTQIPALLAGCTVALFPVAVAEWRVFGPGGAWCAVVVLLAATHLFPYGSMQLNIVGYLVTAVASALVIGHLSRGASALSRVLSIRPLVWLGQRSYAFYLIHSSALVVADLTPLPGPLQAALGFALSIAFAAVSWVVIEKPFLRLKDRTDATSIPAVHQGI